MYATILLLHLLGAILWTGGHLVLTLSILPAALKNKDPQPLLDFESRFEKLAMTALAVQVTTGMMLARHYLPNPALWFAEAQPFSAIIKTKLLLLLLTLLTALSARFRVLPQLVAEASCHTRDKTNSHLLYTMAGHIVVVTLLAMAFVITGLSVRTGWLYQH
ncbi:CopD family protein [Shewanella amazonensis]|uniref:CopD family protein n=1 Tax=Shewanella amazonensis TaxID=60478 RepID=UPI000054F5C2|nr:CopD family protein [Shewanella amazonensis]